MDAEIYQIQLFGGFAPRQARRRLWVEPGRQLPVSREHVLGVYVDRHDDHDQVVFELFHPFDEDGRLVGTIGMSVPELNFDVVARAVARNPNGSARAVLIELINRELAARAS